MATIRLVDLLKPSIDRIDGNTEVTAVVSMENQEVLERIAKALEGSSSFMKKQEKAVEALEDIVKESKTTTEQDQHEQLKEKERKDESAREEEGRMKRLKEMFGKLSDKLKDLAGGGLAFFGKFMKGIGLLLTSYLFPFAVQLVNNFLPTIMKGAAWLFDSFMSVGKALGEGIGGILPGIDAGVAGAVGAIAGLAAAIWVVMNPLRSLGLVLRGAIGAVNGFKRILARPVDVIPDGDGGAAGGDTERRRGRRGRRGGRPGRAPVGPNRPRPQQTSAPARPRVAPRPIARTAATGVPGRVVTGGARAAGAGLGRAGLRAIPIVGTAATIGLGAYDAYTASEEIDAAVAAGEMDAAAASEAKGEAIGSAAGGAGGALAGAAAGAAIGSVVPVIGTAIGGIAGGLLGYYGGDWLGGKAGAAIGAANAPAAAAPPSATAVAQNTDAAARAAATAATTAAVASAPSSSLWNPQADKSDQEQFIVRAFKDQIDYLLTQTQSRPLIVQDIAAYQAMQELANSVNAPVAAPPAPSRAPAGSSIIPTTRSSGLGSVSSKYETGGRGAGTVSTGVGDHGGVSYGSYQLSSTQGTLQRFLGQSKYGSEFAGMEINSQAFKDKWKEIAARDPEGFQADQHAFIKATHFDPAAAAVANRLGIDVSKRGRALQEMLWSTSVQFGPGGAANMLANAGVNANMSDADIIRAVQGYKRSNNERLFKSSNANVRAGTLSRAAAEEADLLALDSAVGPSNRGMGTALASASSAAAQPRASGGNVVVSSPVNAPTTIVQGGRNGSAGPRRHTAPPPAVTYDVGAIA